VAPSPTTTFVAIEHVVAPGKSGETTATSCSAGERTPDVHTLHHESATSVR